VTEHKLVDDLLLQARLAPQERLLRELIAAARTPLDEELPELPAGLEVDEEEIDRLAAEVRANWELEHLDTHDDLEG
jgi:hypothetical protein